MKKLTYKQKRDLQHRTRLLNEKVSREIREEKRLAEDLKDGVVDGKNTRAIHSSEISNSNSLAHEKSLIDDFETELSSNEPIRELWSKKNIRYKSEVTDEQRGAISVLYHAYSLCQKYGIEFDGLKYLLDDWVDFGVPLDRKGRSEYVDAHKATVTNQQNQQKPNSSMDNMKV